MVVEHPSLARVLKIAFEAVWEQGPRSTRRTRSSSCSAARRHDTQQAAAACARADQREHNGAARKRIGAERAGGHLEPPDVRAAHDQRHSGRWGFEQNLRLDPTNPDRIYTSAPDSATSDTSWIWHSEDGGRTFKWVPAGLPTQGKAVSCPGGGDTELAVDSAGHVYFADLYLFNFSAARSNNHAATFHGLTPATDCNSTAVADTVVDRQWFATDGDPTNGGNIYLASNEVGRDQPICGSSNQGNNVLVLYRSPPPVGGGSLAARPVRTGQTDHDRVHAGVQRGDHGQRRGQPDHASHLRDP